jgi:Tfp pilus assembly protein PilO
VKTKNIAVIILAVLLVTLLWHRVVYSSMGNQASKANQAAEDAEMQAKTLEAQVRALGGLDAQRKNPSLQELQNAIPEGPALASFLRAVDTVRVQSGVGFQSIVPNPPAPDGGIASVNLGITVQGTYEQVRDYADRLESLSRLVVVDNVTMNAGAAADGATSEGGPTGNVFAGAGAAPLVSLQLSARVFTSQAPVVATPTPGAGRPSPASSSAPQNN